MNYKSLDGKLHILDGAVFEHLLPVGSILISDAEAEAIRIAAIPPVDKKAVLLAQIATLDPIDQLRPMRDFLLQIAVKEAALLLVTEPQLYATNIGYKRMKDRETALQLLRTQLSALP